MYTILTRVGTTHEYLYVCRLAAVHYFHIFWHKIDKFILIFVKNLTEWKIFIFSMFHMFSTCCSISKVSTLLRDYSFLFFKDIVGLALSYSSKINAVLCPQRVSWPLKERCYVFSEFNAAHPVGVWQPAADNNGRLVHFFKIWTFWVGCDSLPQTIQSFPCFKF